MKLDPGSKLGHYEIVGPLGAGGMGEVYRARDPRLGREVALKVLPAEFSGDPARQARFEQEARAAAALSHPNIVGLHDVGTENGISYFVGELVAGETLTEVIQRGPMPLRRTLDIAVQIADGMAAAHAARITHRDLKPANIMVTPDGRVKILDFGLAKQAPAPTGSPDETVTVHQTTPGMILGTVHYMSPEQARGVAADHRSDQFSFGLILYEMVTGRKAFDKPEIIQTMSAILTDPPPPIETNVPEPLVWAIDRCLAKDPSERYESTSDLFRDLRSIRDHLSVSSTTRPVTPVAAPARKRSISWRRIAAAFSVLSIAAAGFLGGLRFADSRFPDQSAYHYTPLSFSPGGQAWPVWSPDGKAVAYAAAPGANSDEAAQLFVRYLDSPLATQITHVPDAAIPIGWAPDSKRILFRSGRKGGVWSVSSAGGEPQLFAANRHRVAGGCIARPERCGLCGSWKRRSLQRLDQRAARVAGQTLSARSGCFHHVVQRSEVAVLSRWKADPDFRQERQEPRRSLAAALSAESPEASQAGRDFQPRSGLHPAVRFSLAPDGKSFAFSTGKLGTNLWLLDGWAKE